MTMVLAEYVYTCVGRQREIPLVAGVPQAFCLRVKKGDVAHVEVHRAGNWVPLPEREGLVVGDALRVVVSHVAGWVSLELQGGVGSSAMREGDENRE